MSWPDGSPLYALLAATALAVTMQAHAQSGEAIRVYAAGSLRAPMTAVAETFTRANGTRVDFVFGASGLLRDRIAGGERADVFASANMEHPQALVAGGWSAEAKPFARNQICLLVSANVAATPDTALATMLDPRWKLGTSTPKADPSGDYAWDVFRRADAVSPGAFAKLEAKARMLTGGPQSPPPPTDRSVYGMLVASGDADMFLTYCTNAQQAAAEVPGLRKVELPAALRVGATYGVAVRRDAPAAAKAFTTFLESREGQAQLASFGFAPP